MIAKRVQPAQNFRDMHATAHLVGSFSKGLDTGVLQKVASDNYILHMARQIKPERGFGYVHLITTGAGETYGSNNNADYFNKEAREVIYPRPKQGTGKKEKLAGGLKKFHNTFTKYASVYREHFNSKKGGNPLGDVFIEAYNEPMERGELIVRLPEDGWRNELQKLASDEGNVFFSMGAGVPYDICSICGNKSRTRGDYCDHVKYNKLQIDKEGNQVFLYNDQPHFHDISCVETPADRIAFGLSKVASEGGNSEHVFANDPDSGLYIPHSLIEKLAGKIIAERADLLEKLAEIEKRIQLEPASDEVKVLSDSFSDELDSETVDGLTDFPLDDVLSCCNKSSVMLPPKSFVRIVLKKPEGDIDGLEDMEEALPNVFQKLQDDGTEALQDGSYTPKNECHWSGLDKLIEGLQGDHSLEDGPVNKRVMKVIVAGNPKEKVARDTSRAPQAVEGEYLAKEYAKYQLSFLQSQGKYDNLAVMRNAYI